MRQYLPTAVLALLLVSPAARAATFQVTVRNFEFSPAVVNAQVGDTVVWTNVSGTHSVTSDDGTSFSNQAQSAPWTFSHTFNTAGSFPYHCEVHPGMQGAVNVSGGGPPGAPANLQAEARSTTEVMLTWKDANGETGYRIEMRTLTGTFHQVATAGQNETSVIVGGLTPATAYVFRVRAESGAGNSAFSNEARVATDAPVAPCVPTSTALCLNNGRFQVEVSWRTADQSGDATAVPLSFAPDSGLFYFFGQSNIEMLVKVLNACVPALGNKYWVFYAATTNVEFTMAVVDTDSGKTQVYFNPLGTAAAPVQDTHAFATCP
jgi:plastocyanin